MRAIRNVLALIGFLTIIVGATGYFAVKDFLGKLDPEAPRMYVELAQRYMEHLDPAVAMVRRVRVEDGLSVQDVVDSLQSLATTHDMFYVGEAPFYRQVEAVTGNPYRYVNFFSFCDIDVGVMMADHHNAYTAFMPCSIALIEDDDGTLWLMMMDLDLMIHGGKPLPAELREGALRVSNTLDAILQGAARGEF
ncbi:DUF302 domain-containing protein [Thioalkalivibrio paradoxus]|uniref:DUF302 domain-containing protein n=1 Tax=Thioalkalivibrio paradoxus ARh 1 TaxID=713585 RepID=W0DMW7_9GAMM|nr:DUF302 domain-containing protein [Thioalkalivibrio paradoxus]AHE98607.1 hypothetical protein THITH_10515 [Thioalkalivibrio paradoxus ARh 1]